MTHPADAAAPDWSKIWGGVLVLGATMRLTRLVVADDLGEWLLKDPVRDWVIRHAPERGDFNDFGWRGKLAQGLDCPFCVGFWIGAGVLATHAVAGRSKAWRAVALALTLNEVAAHLGVRLGDTAE